MKFALNGAIAGTYLGLHNFSQNFAYVLYFGQLSCRPIVQEISAFQYGLPLHAQRPRIPCIVEGSRIQSETVDRPAKTICFNGAKKSATFEMLSPFLRGIKFHPFGGTFPKLVELLQESK